jgi:CRP-like cAMP-binding protein
MHSAESRLASRLLRMHDLAGEDILHLTQDFLAQMIGVQRNSVSTIAHMLQQAGVIKYARGHIEITNLQALRNASCECYQAVNAQYKRLLNED